MNCISVCAVSSSCSVSFSSYLLPWWTLFNPSNSSQDYVFWFLVSFLWEIKKIFRLVSAFSQHLQHIFQIPDGHLWNDYPMPSLGQRTHKSEINPHGFDDWYKSYEVFSLNDGKNRSSEPVAPRIAAPYLNLASFTLASWSTVRTLLRPLAETHPWCCCA